MEHRPFSRRSHARIVGAARPACSARAAGGWPYWRLAARSLASRRTDAVSAAVPRVAFINVGFLGHAAMADAMQDVARLLPIDATHINLSDALTIRDRLIRRALSVRLAPTSGRYANLDRRRWRQELNIGLLARRRLAASERPGGFDLLHFHTQAAAYASLRRMQRTPS